MPAAGARSQVEIVPVTVGQVDTCRVADLIDALWPDESTDVVVSPTPSGMTTKRPRSVRTARFGQDYPISADTRSR
jgi:hypothetical protein